MPPDDNVESPRSLPSVLLAARFLFPCDDTRCAHDPGWPRARRWFVPWGLAIGAAYMLVYRAAWRWFGEYEYLRLMPVAVVLAVDLGWFGYRLTAGAGRVVGRQTSDAPGGPTAIGLPAWIAVLLIALLKYSMILYLPRGGRVPPPGWRAPFDFLCPEVIYRPLILMPLWGRWAMLLAMSVGRVASAGSMRLGRMTAGSPLALSIPAWLVCAALTLVYGCPEVTDIPRGMVLALAMLVASYLAAFVMARRSGGQTEATVAATGAAAELAFLAMALPMFRHIYWY